MSLSSSPLATPAERGFILKREKRKKKKKKKTKKGDFSAWRPIYCGEVERVELDMREVLHLSDREIHNCLFSDIKRRRKK